MKINKNTVITIIAISLILLGLTSSLLLNANIAERVINVVTTATAIVGAIALFYQFKRDKNLNEASFLVEYSQQFYSTYNCAELMNELERCRVDSSYKVDVEKYYQQIVGYLEWLEYKKKRNLCIIFEENDLRKTEGYLEIISKCKKR